MKHFVIGPGAPICDNEESPIAGRSLSTSRGRFFDRWNMKQAYFTVAWSLGESRFNGPYASFEIAKENLTEECLNSEVDGDHESGGIIGPLPFKQVITDGKWDQDTSEDPPQHAVALFGDGRFDWISMGEDLDEAEQAAKDWVEQHPGEGWVGIVQLVGKPLGRVE